MAFFLLSALGDHSYFAYLEVDDVEALYATVASRGADISKALRVEPWGMREFGIRTVDGHRIMFGSAAT
ncbi:MAG TPA: VOC family protein [Candidatus Cybelea sp.]